MIEYIHSRGPAPSHKIRFGPIVSVGRLPVCRTGYAIVIMSVREKLYILFLHVGTLATKKKKKKPVQKPGCEMGVNVISGYGEAGCLRLQAKKVQEC